MCMQRIRLFMETDEKQRLMTLNEINILNAQKTVYIQAQSDIVPCPAFSG